MVFSAISNRLSDDHGRSRAGRIKPSARKDQRKALRAQKKSGKLTTTSNVSIRSTHSKQDSNDIIEGHGRLRKQVSGRSEMPKSILKNKSNGIDSFLGHEEQKLPLVSYTQPVEAPREPRLQLSADDADIAALEKALGVKGDGALPKSFADDGLNLLLEGLDGSSVKNEQPTAKRKFSGDAEWLHKKRQKATHSGSSAQRAREVFISRNSCDDDSTNNGSSEEDALSLDDDDSELIDSSNNCSTLSQPHTPKPRENPYRPPVLLSKEQCTPKYIPPNLRAEEPSTSEDLTRLRRQLQGLLNRLSDANLLSILRDVENVFRSNPRQHVSSILLDLLIGLLCDPTSLQDTFIILHAGFIAAIYKVIGTDFGAQVIQRIDNAFVEFYDSERKEESNGRRSVNLVGLLAQLYTFQVISSNLIYDFIRLCLEDLTETSAELVLKFMRSRFVVLDFLRFLHERTFLTQILDSGSQLRQDNASSLKEIIVMLQSAIAKIGEESLSVRTKFMVETMNNLKNNRMKTGVAASTIASDHTIRMKKTLGTLNTQNIKASEPLRIGLKDLRDSKKRGKWWSIGASYKDISQEDSNQDNTNQRSLGMQLQEENSTVKSTSTDFVQLAREHRMNTDVRRSIFVAVMSATDYKDAHNRISRLRLKRSQELEIPRVLTHCVSAEESYNPFYSLISRSFCSEKRLRMAFQFSLWNLFKRMGENQEDNGEDPNENDEDELQLRSLVNLAKFFGVLIAEDGIGVGVLKVVLTIPLHFTPVRH